MDCPPKTGTTIVACKYRDGVVVGCDTRVSTGTFSSSFARISDLTSILYSLGQYISNRASDKACNLTSNVVMARSGSAADAEAVSGIVRHHASQLAMEKGGEDVERLDVRLVARLVSKINYDNKSANEGYGLGCFAIVAGWDEREGGKVFSCTGGGNFVEVDWTTDGSGSTFIWGFLDSEYEPNLERDECERYVLKALTLAMAVDASSGGCARLCTVNKDGCFRTFVKADELERRLGEAHFPRGTARAGDVFYGKGKSGGMVV